MRSTLVWACAIAGLATACILNPQPLPPDEGDGAPAGSIAFGADGGKGDDATMHGGRDSGKPAPPPPDAGGSGEGSGGEGGPFEAGYDAEEDGSADAELGDSATDAGGGEASRPEGGAHEAGPG